MNSIVVHGIGAVSPAGWSAEELCAAVAANEPLPTKELARPGWDRCLRTRAVPAPVEPLPFSSHPRLRRASPVTQYGAAAAWEALGSDAPRVQRGELRLGIVFCVMSGCVNYSGRFYEETLRDPATASPLVFPETVFNAPSSHLAAVLGATAINYTLVGDPGTFLQALALGAHWLLHEPIDGCVVIGAEEGDWLTADAFRLFSRRITVSDGAGAVYLRRMATARPVIELRAVTDAHRYSGKLTRAAAALRAREQLPAGNAQELLCDGTQDVLRLDVAEATAWREWQGSRVSPKKILGEGLVAAAAWQCVVAVQALKLGRHTAANVSVAGCNQQALAARFESSE